MPEQGATYTFEDLSGSTQTPTDDPNPYNALIHTCRNDPKAIQARYNAHRTTRASQQRALLLSPDFPGVNIDPILRGVLLQQERDRRQGPNVPHDEVNTNLLEKQDMDSTQCFEDRRHNLVLWARPPPRVREMIGECQKALRKVLPHLWLMPLPSLHMTALEFTHSQTPDVIDALVARLKPVTNMLIDFPYVQQHATSQRRVRLVKPMLTYDAAAVALSFLPAASQPGDKFTYHHLRSALWDLSSITSKLNRGKGNDDETRGVEINTRYIVPSAHLTIARFVTAKDTTVDGTEDGGVDVEKMRKWVEVIEQVNESLEREYWVAEGKGDDEMQWVIGEEKGLDFRSGACWYGGGESNAIGQGF